MDPKNSHPISLPPLMSKVLERIVHEKTMEFLDKDNILYKFQSGFQKNHSTNFFLSYLTDKISKGFNAGLLNGVILIDLLKAFDTTGFELVKQNQFTKISDGNKEKGPEQAKVFFGSTNHFMKNAKSFKFLQTNLVKFCEFKSFSFFV